jgi:hypothetical protein
LFRFFDLKQKRLNNSSIFSIRKGEYVRLLLIFSLSKELIAKC